MMKDISFKLPFWSVTPKLLIYKWKTTVLKPPDSFLLFLFTLKWAIQPGNREQSAPLDNIKSTAVVRR